MGEQKRKKQNELHRSSFIFKKKNYKVMLIGLGVIALGFILMSGGGSDDPNVFNPEIYNWRRIRLAPALVLIGFGIVVYAILLNPDKNKNTN
ncbi:DUF3098 domain-containing protein [Leeuwenhoekiella sp.]|uniref:DUF3098 domain-containing protein n=1 Tax=Leeuwenhoekiella sp. TaxID=1977054 RepID=UPI000C5271C3|nr:DUF3098 domain-containing protein [Leeuwenhoekiella sp.]MAO43890.1 hypothetical protein [Leeuwenhoekiella sp.]